MDNTQYLFNQYRHLVHKIVSGFQRKVPRNILRDDLVAAGMRGLWDALRKHPDGGDESFEWYVRVRIRGAIIDELRSQDWLPRRARAISGDIAIVREDDIDPAELRAAQVANDVAADELIDRGRQREQLLGLVNFLPQRLRIIAVEHYFNGRKLKDLAVDLGVSEPRISQLKSRLISNLQQAMKEQTNGSATESPPESSHRGRLRVSRR